MIEARKLTKFYGPSRGIHDISFQIGKGEIVGLLGPNGAGKSTTIRILTGYIPPTSGAAFVGGFDTLTQSTRARNCIGYLPENVPIYPELRVEEYLYYRAALKNVPRSERRARVESAIERVRLQNYRKRISGHLSKGYRQRLGLAGALVADPPVLILDEPTVGLDPNQVFEMRALVRDLSVNRTILLSTHILPEVEAVCSRVLVINEGRLAADEPMDQLLRNAAMERARVRMTVRNADPQLANRLRAIAGVETVTFDSDSEPGCSRWRIEVLEGHDARESIVKSVLAGGGVPIEIAAARASLEEVFGNLTRHDAAAPAEVKA
ncbi:MAG: ABC transporter ATP-binding protein [Planctomycetota bacterium]